jgi:hypothetical protein
MVNAKAARLTTIAAQVSAERQGRIMTKSGPGVPGGVMAHALASGGLTFRFLVAVDVAGFSKFCAAEQAEIQDDLEDAMTQAAASTGLDREQWYRQPRGDGELAVLPVGVDGLSLVADYPRALASRIADANPASGTARLRVRLAVHHGAVIPGRFGPVGTALITVSRLVDAPVVRQQLHQRSDLHTALIVSATIHDEVIQSRLRNLSPDTFRRANIRAKGIAYVGYLYQGSFETRDSLVPAGLATAMDMDGDRHAIGSYATLPGSATAAKDQLLVPFSAQ